MFFLSGLINEFKDFDYSAARSWQALAERRLEIQMDHVLDDGMHDEHSLLYNFFISNFFNKIADYLIANDDRFAYDTALISRIIDTVQKMNIYLLHATKPIDVLFG